MCVHHTVHRGCTAPIDGHFSGYSCCEVSAKVKSRLQWVHTPNILRKLGSKGSWKKSCQSGLDSRGVWVEGWVRHGGGGKRNGLDFQWWGSVERWFVRFIAEASLPSGFAVRIWALQILLLATPPTLLATRAVRQINTEKAFVHRSMSDCSVIFCDS